MSRPPRLNQGGELRSSAFMCKAPPILGGNFPPVVAAVTIQRVHIRSQSFNGIDEALGSAQSTLRAFGVLCGNFPDFLKRLQRRGGSFGVLAICPRDHADLFRDILS